MKIRLTGATFDASEKTITHTSFSDVGLAGIQLITNVTDGVIIYNFADSAKGGTLATDTLTLDHDTTAMDDADDLMILVEDGTTTQPVSGTVTAELGATDNAVLDAIAASVASIDTDATTIIGYVDGIETAIASTNTKLDTIITNTADTETGVDGLETLITSTNTKLDTIITNTADTETAVDGLETSNSAIQTAVELIDDAIKTDDAAFTPATTKVLMAGFEYDDTATDSVDEGDAGAARISSNRNVYVQLRDGANNERGATVDATGALNIRESGSALTALQLLDDAVYTDDTSTHTTGTSKGYGIMAVAVPTDTAVNANDIAMPGMSLNRELFGVIRDAAGNARGANVNASNQLSVTGPVTNAGTFAVQVDGNALTALQLIDDTVFADDAAVTLGTSKGNVAAGVAVATDGTDPTAVSAEGDAAALRTDMNRLLIVNQTHPRFWHVSADYAAAQTNVSVKAAPGASLSLYITDIQVSNGATAGNVTLLDGSGGTVLYELYPAINGGATLSLRSPIKLTANTALCLTSTTVTTHSIFVSGYIAP
jgi:hypothetical protein